jgi:hypothetical protein
MNLGELIELLKPLRKDAIVLVDGPCRLTPGGLESYRGYYEDLAIGVNVDSLAPTVAEFLAELEAAVGKTFHGYKGGEYRMSLRTRVWFSNHGECSDNGPTGIAPRDADDYVVRLTYGRAE